MMQTRLSRDILKIEPREVVERLCTDIADLVFTRLRRRGVVLGISGGVDSSVVAALCARAVGNERVLGLLMPERDVAGASTELGLQVAGEIGIGTITDDIDPVLEGAGCYRRRDEAIAAVVPGYSSKWKTKLVSPGVLELGTFRVYSIIAQDTTGRSIRVRLPPPVYRTVVAATNFKQRTRKMFEYFHADRLGYAVAGTPNRLEYDQGFFVKNGDGAADVKPIAHLYKSQVYQLAEYLGLPDEVRQRAPTTDTFSLSQSQEEFYFSLPHEQMDLCLFARNHGIVPKEVSLATGLPEEQVVNVFRDIDSKRRAAEYLHLPPLLLSPVEEVGAMGATNTAGEAVLTPN